MKVLDFDEAPAAPVLLSKFMDRFRDAEVPGMQFESEAALPQQLECAFEPIYRHSGSLFGLQGHRAVSTSSFSADDIGAYLDKAVSSGPLSVSDVLGLGICQIAMVQKHLESFAEQYQAEDTLHLEIDIADLETNLTKLAKLEQLITSAVGQGLPANAFVVELSSSPRIELGALYSVSNQLKQLGVQVALTDVDADNFSLNRVFVAEPDAVRFNRSWCHFGVSSDAYLNFVKSTIRSLDDMGVETGIDHLECEEDVNFAVKAGFGDFSGIALSQPQEVMDRHSIEFYRKQDVQLCAH